jgi:oligopeptide/dipeptide ABC transporter ATP-binding protein
MRQRAMIAMALSCNPSLLIADEPTTALDVTTQAQILDLMRDLQNDFDSAIILITHNLGVVSQMADFVAVMYLGKIVEYSDVNSIFHDPKHPYTVGLLDSVPVFGRKGDKVLVPIKGMVPTPSDIIPGCSFAPRCSKAMDICLEKSPEIKLVSAQHEVACWLYE